MDPGSFCKQETQRYMSSITGLSSNCRQGKETYEQTDTFLFLAYQDLHSQYIFLTWFRRYSFEATVFFLLQFWMLRLYDTMAYMKSLSQTISLLIYSSYVNHKTDNSSKLFIGFGFCKCCMTVVCKTHLYVSNSLPINKIQVFFFERKRPSFNIFGV